jgi:orotate phosphoribosyltransferase
MKDLIKFGSFTSHSGLTLPWKIDCDNLSNNDIEAFAAIISGQFSFKEVVGVPTGGLRLAKALKKYSKEKACNILIVDDVLTTGKSMNEYYNKIMQDKKLQDMLNIYGVVLFARGVCPSWIVSLFQLNQLWS